MWWWWWTRINISVCDAGKLICIRPPRTVVVVVVVVMVTARG